MQDYKVFKPTQELLDELNKQNIYRDELDLLKTIHRQKMLLLRMAHKPIPDDRTEFSTFYNEYVFEASILGRLVIKQQELYFKQNVEAYLKEPKYYVEIPVNDLMHTVDVNVEHESQNTVMRLFENTLIQCLRGEIDYDKQHDEWYERFNELNGDIDWLEEEFVKIAHYSIVNDYSKYIMQYVDDTEEDNTVEEDNNDINDI